MILCDRFDCYDIETYFIQAWESTERNVTPDQCFYVNRFNSDWIQIKEKDIHTMGKATKAMFKNSKNKTVEE